MPLEPTWINFVDSYGESVYSWVKPMFMLLFFWLFEASESSSSEQSADRIGILYDWCVTLLDRDVIKVLLAKCGLTEVASGMLQKIKATEMLRNWKKEDVLRHGMPELDKAPLTRLWYIKNLMNVRTDDMQKALQEYKPRFHNECGHWHQLLSARWDEDLPVSLLYCFWNKLCNDTKYLSPSLQDAVLEADDESMGNVLGAQGHRTGTKYPADAAEQAIAILMHIGDGSVLAKSWDALPTITAVQVEPVEFKVFVEKSRALEVLQYLDSEKTVILPDATTVQSESAIDACIKKGLFTVRLSIKNPPKNQSALFEDKDLFKFITESRYEIFRCYWRQMLFKLQRAMKKPVNNGELLNFLKVTDFKDEPIEMYRTAHECCLYDRLNSESVNDLHNAVGSIAIRKAASGAGAARIVTMLHGVENLAALAFVPTVQTAGQQVWMQGPSVFYQPV